MRGKIRKTAQKVEATSKRLSDHLTLDVKIEIYILAKSYKDRFSKDLPRF